MGPIRRMGQNTVPTPSQYQRYRSCDRKRIYPTVDDAWAAVESLKEKGKDPYPEFELRPYICQFCRRIHIGHSNTPIAVEQRIVESNLCDADAA